MKNTEARDPKAILTRNFVPVVDIVPVSEIYSFTPNTVIAGNFVSLQTLIGFFLKKSFWYGRPFFFSVDVQIRGLGSGSL